MFNTKDKIGGVKIETNKKCNDTKIQLTKGIDMDALMVLAAPIVVNNISIVDEWDTDFEFDFFIYELTAAICPEMSWIDVVVLLYNCFECV